MTMNPRIAPHVASRPFPLNIQYINQKRLTMTNQLRAAIKTLLIGPVPFPFFGFLFLSPSRQVPASSRLDNNEILPRSISTSLADLLLYLVVSF